MHRLVPIVFALGFAANPGAPADSRLTADVDRLIQASGADVAVAFRMLDGSQELFVQADAPFHAASTMKVAVMIELYRQARAGFVKLDDRVPLKNEFRSIVDRSTYALNPADDSDQELYKRVGTRVSYRDLCEAMITVSSNLATNVLIEKLSPAKIQATTDMLGATGMQVLRGVEDSKAFEKGLNNTATARALFTLMDRLAHGQVGDKAASDEMIAVLARQKFNDRIPAGVPAGTRIAHKTGEITKIQHDAAIVYAPRPYVLVVLVRGIEDQKKGSALIAEISRAVYRATQATTEDGDGASVVQAFRPASDADVVQAVRPASQSSNDPTAALLSEVIRFDTSNPPGRTAPLDTFLAERLRPLGFEIDIVPTPDEGKSHLIARLRGDGSRRPVLLAAHGDVVGVERDKWSVDPFAGIIRDGHVFGRGAIDFKGGIAVFTRAVMMLAENKVPLARDVILVVEADEEGARYNTSWLAQTAWPKIDCELALNEGGWIIKDAGGRPLYVSISTADKSSIALLVTAKGTSTHSSMPLPDNAIFTLSRALAKLSSYETKVQLIPSTRKFLETLARTSAPPMSGYFQTLATSFDPAAVAAADREISRDPLLHAIVRNTIAPVLLNAGFRGNVIPGSAEATINVRAVPGTDPADVVRELTEAIGDPGVEVKLANPAAPTTRPSPSTEDTDLFRALAKEARTTFGGAVEVTPYLFQAGTDAGAWRSRGVPVYGIYPYPITAEELRRMHGTDEQVSVESLRQGTEMIYRTLVDVAAKSR